MKASIESALLVQLRQALTVNKAAMKRSALGDIAKINMQETQICIQNAINLIEADSDEY